MSPQTIPLKGRKICGAPAEFWPQRLFAFEMRAGEMPLGPSAAGIFSKRYAPNAVPAGSDRPRGLTRWLRAPPLRVNTYAAPVAGGLSAPTVGSWGLLLLLRAAFRGALRWLRRAAPHGLQRLFVLRSTGLSR
jgi:hypothetical protein